MAPRVYLVDDHHQVLSLWRERDLRNLKLAHLDAHCDLRGLVVGEGGELAARIDASAPSPSNFLAIAAAEGRVAEVRWFHDAWSGRRRDSFTVLFEKDLGYWPFRRHRKAWESAAKRPFRLRVRPLEEFSPEPGEVLDVDWDLFFQPGKPLAAGEAQISALLGADWAVLPEEAYVSHSPEYSATSREPCERFAKSLAAKLGGTLEDRRSPETGRRAARFPRRLARRVFVSLRNAAIAMQGGRFE